MKRSNNDYSIAPKPKKGFFIRDILDKPENKIIPISLDDNKENIPPNFYSKDNEQFKRGQHKSRRQFPTTSCNINAVQSSMEIALPLNSNIWVENPYKLHELSDSYEGRQQKKWECNKCDRYFDRPSLLDRHARTHTGERPFTCLTCQKTFSSSSSLNTHSRIHTGERPHICEICGKCFTASSNLYYHRMTHFEQKPHQCSFCEKSFPTPGDLRNHLPIHTNMWPLLCPCGRGFVKANPFRNHLLTHLGLPRYQCKLCSTSFSLLRLLKKHLTDEHKLTACECSTYWQTHLSDDGRSECRRLLELVKKSYNSKCEF